MNITITKAKAALDVIIAQKLPVKVYNRMYFEFNETMQVRRLHHGKYRASNANHAFQFSLADITDFDVDITNLCLDFDVDEDDRLEAFRGTRDTVSPEMAADQLDLDVDCFDGYDEVLCYKWHTGSLVYICKKGDDYILELENGISTSQALGELERELFDWCDQSM